MTSQNDIAPGGDVTVVAMPFADQQVGVSQPCSDVVAIEWGGDDGHRLWLSIDQATDVYRGIGRLLVEIEMDRDE